MAGDPQPTLDQTVERTRNARGKPAFDVYRALGSADVKAIAAAGIDGLPIGEGATVLVQVQRGVQAASADLACWKIAEGPLNDEALSDDPPVLCAGNSRADAGLSAPKPYRLERTVKRAKS